MPFIHCNFFYCARISLGWTNGLDTTALAPHFFSCEKEFQARGAPSVGRGLSRRARPLWLRASPLRHCLNHTKRNASRPSISVMGGHGEGLQRPCGDQPERSVRRGKPQASEGRRHIKDFVVIPLIPPTPLGQSRGLRGPCLRQRSEDGFPSAY